METTKLLLVLLFAFHNLQISSTSKILFFWGMSGYSHRITVWPLVEKLAERGHSVTFFSPHPPKKPSKNPNITEIVPEGLWKNIGLDFDPAEVRLKGGVAAVDELWPVFMQCGVNMCKALAQDKTVLNWAETAEYDLVVINGLFNDCGFAFAHKFKAPTVIYGTTSIFPWWGEAHGLPDENLPEMQYHMPTDMTFLQQTYNSMLPMYWLMLRSWFYFPELESIIRPALNLPDMPPLGELDRQSSLILTNTHFSEEFARSLPPLVVSIGGMHCQEKSNPLPDDIQKFLDSWEDGIVYLSFGTYMRLPLLPQGHREAILGAIRKFPSIGFVLKWNGGDLPKDIPKNALLAEWLPQQDILVHPNIKVFISHGGLLSTQEAIYHAIPIIVFPIFAEQDYNAQRIHSAERGIMMEIADLTQGKLEDAIHEVLTNKKYKQNMDKVSRIFRDRPEKPVDTAAWWVEYVLRHKNTTFLRPIGSTRTWYERRLLHIWAFVVSAILVALIGTVIIIRLLLSILFKTTVQPKTKKMKTK